MSINIVVEAKKVIIYSKKPEKIHIKNDGRKSQTSFIISSGGNCDGNKMVRKIFYSDITSGSRTAQAIFETNSGNILSVGIPITFRAGADSEAIIARYKEQFSFAQVYGVEENINQMFGSMINSVKMASYAAIGVTVLFTVLVTVLFIKMLGIV